jgi:hypothetical protein
VIGTSFVILGKTIVMFSFCGKMGKINECAGSPLIGCPALVSTANGLLEGDVSIDERDVPWMVHEIFEQFCQL